MPIVDVEIVTQRGERLPPALAVGLADALGEVYGAGPGRPAHYVHVIVEPAMKGRIAFGGKLAT